MPITQFPNQDDQQDPRKRALVSGISPNDLAASAQSQMDQVPAPGQPSQDDTPQAPKVNWTAGDASGINSAALRSVVQKDPGAIQQQQAARQITGTPIPQRQDYQHHGWRKAADIATGLGTGLMTLNPAAGFGAYRLMRDSGYRDAMKDYGSNQAKYENDYKVSSGIRGQDINQDRYEAQIANAENRARIAEERANIYEQATQNRKEHNEATEQQGATKITNLEKHRGTTEGQNDKKIVETGRHNRAEEGLGGQRNAETGRHDLESERQGAERIRIAEGREARQEDSAEPHIHTAWGATKDTHNALVKARNSYGDDAPETQRALKQYTEAMDRYEKVHTQYSKVNRNPAPGKTQASAAGNPYRKTQNQ